jgi:hypothetical protein
VKGTPWPLPTEGGRCGRGDAGPLVSWALGKKGGRKGEGEGGREGGPWGVAGAWGGGGRRRKKPKKGVVNLIRLFS